MEISQKLYFDWLASYPWEGFLTARIPNDVHAVRAYLPLVEQVLRPLARHLKIRLGAISVVSFGHPGEQRPHFHVLLTSKAGQLLPWIEEAQRFLGDGAANLLLPFAPERHLHYTAGHMTGEGDINFYDRKLLEALKTKGVTP
ncbi:hypothetical protein Gbem_4141 [Citrifermentans bemidjiense Bem]|uniref:Uncharacterized protein n=1 Tax=Citrifermentans bemidjiense (strain ATCC BAA-1014 / DSM 16622 / JCM 12645 / Bem) TaxID=404380 RepID=E1P6E7_CITBB|nr:hypothetical protein [Citrifermentans bemidjiense]ADO00842.1 hypothetical protein Gbem_4141 [Citrifermentans bemidjiense Bem]